MSELFKRYIVGGAVRDRLLGLPVQDRDWVVVGASPEALVAAGYKPVGKDFPVFLHPHTREEHALARTERKTAPGYHGFVFHADADVTLEEDLQRRDLTINAIAEDADGQLIDPFDGQRDIAARLFRHVSPAFAEDPVRILRVARFAARFGDFSVAPETLALMRAMVTAGEVDHLVPERVWQELARGLLYAHPARMIEVLRACGALSRLLPEVDALLGASQHPQADSGAHLLRMLEAAARTECSLAVRWAALLHVPGEGSTARVEAVCARLKVPVECRELALLAAREAHRLRQPGAMRADRVSGLLERCDVQRRPARFDELLALAACDFQAHAGEAARPDPQLAQWRELVTAFRSVDAGAIAAACADKRQIPAQVQAARQEAVAAVLGRSHDA